ncbi:transcription factor grauzone-like [Malaya genurostris]|uniref:transcription factor grauzone-like n=1 Tax=Malaya genurostris TaxID=325434 RepID=UPI0026F3AF70|nr:transcription factor grauzone-like [Malaya genurostris]
MENITEGCRLCLDPIADNIHSIENVQIKEQINQVFRFSIENKTGYPTNICQDCSHIIAEFYQYSEKVRLNQQRLDERQNSICDTVKAELLSEPEEQVLSVDLNIEQPKTEPEENGDEPSDGEIFVECYEPPVRRGRKKHKKEILPRRKRDKTIELVKERTIKHYNIKSKEQLESEDKMIKEFYRMICELCGEPESSFNSLASHFRKIHGRTGYIRCCKRKLFKRCDLLQHMALHTNPNAYRCELCNKSYKHKMYLLLHQTKAHGSEEERPFKCDRCKQSYTKEYMLRNHMISHEKVQCPQCDRLLANKAALNVHIINKHSSDLDRKMICDTCGQEFLNKVCFERHVKRHLGMEEAEQKFQCHICQKWLMGERGLQKHLQFTHYERDQTHTCDICQQQYPNSRALWSHKRIVHIEEKFECEFCGKKFKRAINLKEHRTTHTGEVLYSCDVCGATMNSNANLYTHTKKSHPLEWAEKRRKAIEANKPKQKADN